MRIAITGGTGFVGRQLALTLESAGHEVVIVARGAAGSSGTPHPSPRTTFFPMGIDDEVALAAAFTDCKAVAHLAGINREVGRQTYQRVHVVGTRHVVNAAQQAGVQRFVLLSFLRARPGCGSPYHETKWAAEEIVRASGLDYTILKAGVIFGPGDHMLGHLIRALCLSPVFPRVGMRDQMIRPIAVEDLIRILTATLLDDRLSRQTVAVVGPEELAFSEVVRRVAGVAGKRPLIFGSPVAFHAFLAWGFEKVMRTPLTSRSEVRMLSEGMSEALPACGALPADLAPQTAFGEEQIRRGMEDEGCATAR